MHWGNRAAWGPRPCAARQLWPWARALCSSASPGHPAALVGAMAPATGHSPRSSSSLYGGQLTCLQIRGAATLLLKRGASLWTRPRVSW